LTFEAPDESQSTAGTADGLLFELGLSRARINILGFASKGLFARAAYGYASQWSGFDVR
jgi:hypothetical protein